MDKWTPVEVAPQARRPRRFPLIAVLVVFALLIGGLVWVDRYYRGCKVAPPSTGRTVSFEVPEGATGDQVVQALHDEGLVPCAGFVGNLLLRATGRSTEIRAGTYRLSEGLSLDEIMTVLTTPPPKVPTYEVLFPEGLRIRTTYPGERTIASIARDEMGLSGSKLADLAESGRYSLPPYLPKGTPTAEGFLFPKTYRFVKQGLTEHGVIEAMLAQFRADVADLPWSNAKALGLTPYQVVIVASMIEREAAVPEDRPVIAGVIYNRLQKGQQLGIDATLLYDDPTPDGSLSTPDLETDTPYNTRINAGLPPTPISNPGHDSLAAALQPEETDFMYYVLCPQDGEGKHRFARIYEEHLRNVQVCLGD